MYVEFELPDIPVNQSGFDQYWRGSIFIKAPSERYQINALTGTYVRLVEAALIEYRLGAEKFREFWSTHTSLNMGAMHRSTSHFETCISNMYIATKCYRRLKKDRLQDPIAQLLCTKKVEFAKDPITDKFRLVRNTIHHLEKDVMEGRIVTGQPFALKPDGPEVKHPTELNQTIKTIDRLVIGKYELLFSDLVLWLSEMSEVVVAIAEHLSNSYIPQVNN